MSEYGNSYFSQKTGFDISCKFCMKCQTLFSGKNKKNIINLSPAELAVKNMVQDILTTYF